MANNNDLVIQTLQEKSEFHLQQSDFHLQQHNALQVAIKELGGSKIPKTNGASSLTTTDSNYDSSQPIRQKIVHTLKQNNRFMHIREIAGFIKEYDRSNEEIEIFINRVRAQLIPLKKDKIISSLSPDGQLRNTVWGSVKWIDDEGNIKPGFEPDQSALKQKIDYDI